MCQLDMLLFLPVCRHWKFLHLDSSWNEGIQEKRNIISNQWLLNDQEYVHYLPRAKIYKRSCTY
jgi:hypothetical protein